jgi:hypothetical protein
MDSILFYKLLHLIIPLVFIIGGIYLVITQRKNKISVIISFIVILVGGFNLKNTLYDYPNLTESKTYYNDFRMLNASDLKEILVTSNIINQKPEIKSKVISNKNQIKEILSFMDYNELKTFEFKDWSPENCYTIEYVTNVNETYKFSVCESEDERSYIDFLYLKNEIFVTIGYYRNDLIKKLDILELK